MVKTLVIEEFQIEATSLPGDGGSTDWRVTTIHRASGLRHEFYVHAGRLHHVQMQSSPPWTHGASFVVGRRVKRILGSEKDAIGEAIKQFELQMDGKPQ
jgi:hypothetical protein